MARVQGMAEWQAAGRVAAFAPFGSEVAIDSLLQSALDDGKSLCLPITDPRQHVLTLHEVASLDVLVRGHFGIREPPPNPVPPESVDLVLVPGLVFDPRGHRVGYGRGYFDRLLATMPRARKVGVAFDEQIVAHVPDEVHDIPVDCVVTESRILVAG